MMQIHIFLTRAFGNNLRKTLFSITWFENNHIKLNIDKFCLIVSDYKDEQVCANIGKDLIWVKMMLNFFGLLFTEI